MALSRMEIPADKDALLLRHGINPSCGGRITLILHTCNLSYIACGRLGLVTNQGAVARRSSWALAVLALCYLRRLCGKCEAVWKEPFISFPPWMRQFHLRRLKRSPEESTVPSMQNTHFSGAFPILLKIMPSRAGRTVSHSCICMKVFINRLWSFCSVEFRYEARGGSSAIGCSWSVYCWRDLTAMWRCDREPAPPAT